MEKVDQQCVGVLILDSGSWIFGLGFLNLDLGVWIFEFWILDLGFWVSGAIKKATVLPQPLTALLSEKKCS